MGLDVDSTVIKKTDFLYQLTSGRVVPFKIVVRNDVTYYKCYNINEAQPDIKSTIKQQAANEIDHFEMQGQSLPAYQFTDIAGRKYTPENTKDKMVVLKFWHIGCVACVQKFLEVNKVVDTYKDRDEILFISLVFDNKEDLVEFLKAKELKYATVPGMKHFMEHRLHISSYPTHMPLDKAGKIVKVVVHIDELELFLEKQAAATLL